VIETLQSEIPDNETLRTMHAQAEEFLNEEKHLELSSSPLSLESEPQSAPDVPVSDSNSSKLQERRKEGNDDASGVVPSPKGENTFEETSNSSTSSPVVTPPSSRKVSRLRDSGLHVTEGERPVIEQFESGVYVTLVVLPSGYKVFKRIRFRYNSYFFSNQFPHILSLCLSLYMLSLFSSFMKMLKSFKVFYFHSDHQSYYMISVCCYEVSVCFNSFSTFFLSFVTNSY